MIPTGAGRDQHGLAAALTYDALLQRYRAFFALLDWRQVPERVTDRAWPGPAPHPEAAYVKAVLVKLCEQKPFVTDLRDFLLEHPLWQHAFDTIPLRAGDWLRCILVASSALWLRELSKVARLSSVRSRSA